MPKQESYFNLNCFIIHESNEVLLYSPWYLQLHQRSRYYLMQWNHIRFIDKWRRQGEKETEKKERKRQMGKRKRNRDRERKKERER